MLGLGDSPAYDQQAVHSEFKEQLVGSEQGWYETGLPWKGDQLCGITTTEVYEG